MTYNPIIPPFTLSFRDMPKKELRRYFTWFMEILPSRIDELSRIVRHTNGYENWQPDESPESLDLLGQWFAEQVTTQPLSEQEKKAIEEKLKFPTGLPDYKLTTITLSLTMDIGMYLSQVFMKNHPQLSWDQPFGGKRFVDYGQPVLVAFRPSPFNPVRMVVTLAYGIARHGETRDGLRDIYNIWSNLIS